MRDADRDLIEKSDEDVRDIVKVFVIGADRPEPQRVQKDAMSGSLAGAPEDQTGTIRTAMAADSLSPPYSVDHLCRLLEISNALRQNVAAYETNIDGFGHTFVPVIDLDSDDAFEKVKDAMLLERAFARKAAKAAGIIRKDDPQPQEQKPAQQQPGAADQKPANTRSDGAEEIPDEEVQKRIAQLREEMRLQKYQAEAFFEYCVVDESFIALRKKMRHDNETTGNGYWEVIRNQGGQVAQFVHMPSRSMTLRSKYPEAVEVKVPIQVGPLLVRTETMKRRFRSFVQSNDSQVVYFKEFGDPRTISSKTGKIYADPATLEAEEPGVPGANEVIHFKVYSSRSPYGIPRWIGNLLSVLGSRQSEEVNFLYFDNKSIPPLVITVSGGRFTEDSVKKIESYVENEIKGKKNFHKILILEAQSQAPLAAGLDNSGTGQCRIEIKPLTDAHLKDALFQQYDANNIDKIGMAFRLPRLLRGDIRDFNRATAEAALDFAEQQVFMPERNDFDFMINRLIMPAIGITFWHFKSNGIQIKDPVAMAQMLQQLAATGGIVPKDVRRIASEEIFNKDLGRIDEPWMDQPLPLTVAGLSPTSLLGGMGGADTGELDQGIADAKASLDAAAPTKKALQLALRARKNLLEKARQILKVRDLFTEAESDEAQRKMAAAKKAADAKANEEGETIVIKMTRSELTALGIEPVEAAE